MTSNASSRRSSVRSAAAHTGPSQQEYDGLNDRCTGLEEQIASLKSRADAAEKQLAAVSTERDAAVRTAGDHKKRCEEAELETAGFKAQMGDERDIYAQLEEEKRNAKRHNELRLSVEANFASLSEAFEELQAEHEDLNTRFSDADRDARIFKARTESLEEAHVAIEAQLMATQQERDETLTSLNMKTSAFDREVKDHLATKAELERMQRLSRELQEQAETQRFTEDKLRKEIAGQKREAQELHVIAENAGEMELRNDQLMAQQAASQKEVSELRLLVGRLQAQITTMDEEEKIFKQTSVSLKQYQLLRDQLAESQKRCGEVQRSEKRWQREREQLLDEILKLKQELKSRQPKKNRMMEMEVQNELLMGMLKSSPKQFNAARKAPGARGKAQQTPPRQLPPLEANTSNGTDSYDDADLE